MRAVQATAALAALALAIPQAPTVSAQVLKPLSSIFSCQAGGGKQGQGAVIGGVVGGVVGNRVAGSNSRTLGTVLGAAVGAAAGSYIGCRMNKSDQRKAQAATQQALNSNRDGSWSNNETGASGDIRMVGGQAAPVSMSGLRLASGVELASSYEGAGGRYQARNTANLRGSPSTSSPVVGRLAPGEGFDALARTGSWLLAGRNGVGVGYVAESVVRPAAGTTQASNCRTFDQTIRTQAGSPETQRYTACRAANGEWVVQA